MTWHTSIDFDAVGPKNVDEEDGFDNGYKFFYHPKSDTFHMWPLDRLGAPHHYEAAGELGIDPRIGETKLGEIPPYHPIEEGPQPFLYGYGPKVDDNQILGKVNRWMQDRGII